MKAALLVCTFLASVFGAAAVVSFHYPTYATAAMCVSFGILAVVIAAVMGAIADEEIEARLRNLLVRWDRRTGTVPTIRRTVVRTLIFFVVIAASLLLRETHLTPWWVSVVLVASGLLLFVANVRSLLKALGPIR
jgi:uncharacterized membrane protein YkvI